MVSTFEFTPIPQDIEKGNTQIQIQTHPSRCHCRRWETLLRFALITLFMVSAAFRLSKTPPPPLPISPTLSLNSLSVPHFNISDGELSATWDASLTISDNLNLTVHRMDASIWYEDQEALAWISPMHEKHLGVIPKKEKIMKVRFKTTGWEKDQPIIDDTVIAEMAENRKRGVIMFNLKVRMEGELSTGEWALGFITYQTCPDLEVQFPSPEEGGTAALTHGGDVSCTGLTEWGHVRSLL